MKMVSKERDASRVANRFQVVLNRNQLGSVQLFQIKFLNAVPVFQNTIVLSSSMC